MKSLRSATLQNRNLSSENLRNRFSPFGYYAMISIMLTYILAACAPVCEVLPDTAFVATVLDVEVTTETANTHRIIVKYNQYRLRVNIDNQVPLIGAMGNDFSLTDLSKGQELSILGILTQPNVVQAQEVRLILQLSSTN